MDNKKSTVKYRELRGRLISRGLNLKKFAEERGYPLQTVYSAAKSERCGIISKRIRKELEDLINA